MAVAYPVCPDCGTEFDNRPLFTGPAPYDYPAWIDHGGYGCDTTKWIVRVHPDGTVEQVQRVPSYMRLEHFEPTLRAAS